MQNPCYSLEEISRDRVLHRNNKSSQVAKPSNNFYQLFSGDCGVQKWQISVFVSGTAVCALVRAFVCNGLPISDLNQMSYSELEEASTVRHSCSQVYKETGFQHLQHTCFAKANEGGGNQ